MSPGAGLRRKLLPVTTGGCAPAGLPELEEGEEPDQKWKLAAYEAWKQFASHAGRYEVEGDSLTLRAFVAKNPDDMSGFPDNAETIKFRVEGEMLHLHFGDDFVVTARRVEGMESAY